MKDDSTIHGYNLNLTAETTSLIDEIVVTDGKGPVKFLNGTHMTVNAVDAGLLVLAVFCFQSRCSRWRRETGNVYKFRIPALL